MCRVHKTEEFCSHQDPAKRFAFPSANCLQRCFPSRLTQAGLLYSDLISGDTSSGITFGDNICGFDAASTRTLHFACQQTTYTSKPGGPLPLRNSSFAAKLKEKLREHDEDSFWFLFLWESLQDTMPSIQELLDQSLKNKWPRHCNPAAALAMLLRYLSGEISIHCSAMVNIDIY